MLNIWVSYYFAGTCNLVYLPLKTPDSEAEPE